MRPDPTTAHRRALLRKGTELLEQVRPESSSARSGVDVHHVVRIGDPRVVLPEVSAIAALVVVGSRGRGPLRSLLLGSTAVALVRHARCPVVVHRGDLVPSSRRGIAVGVDDSQDALQVLDFAFTPGTAARRAVDRRARAALHCRRHRPTTRSPSRAGPTGNMSTWRPPSRNGCGSIRTSWWTTSSGTARPAGCCWTSPTRYDSSWSAFTDAAARPSSPSARQRSGWWSTPAARSPSCPCPWASRPN